MWVFLRILLAKPIHLLVDLTPQTAYWRGVIAGAASYCREQPSVRLRIPTAEWELIPDSHAVDCVIAVVRNNRPDETARRFDKPIVNVSSISECVGYPTITLDNYVIGRAAADHLLAQGYRHFAYHLESRVYFSRERLAGFQNRLQESKRSCDVFDTAPTSGRDDTPASLRAATESWVRSLPKPLGLFTHNDVRAALLLDICKDAGLAVPTEVGVIGVDDDELVCEACSPELSSIDNAPDLIGYRAAALAVELARGLAHPRDLRILIPPRAVVPRDSTQPVFMDDSLLARAVTFIRQHATDPISVSDILEASPMSRRVLERRFRQHLGRSPAQEIRRIQIEKAQGLLVETDHTLNQIADRCGFAQFRNFATAFRRQTGMTPTAYRRQFRMR